MPSTTVRAAVPPSHLPLLSFIVHRADGAVLNLRLGHFTLNAGFT
jgi:hypothetical protein